MEKQTKNIEGKRFEDLTISDVVYEATSDSIREHSICQISSKHQIKIRVGNSEGWYTVSNNDNHTELTPEYSSYPKLYTCLEAAKQEQLEIRRRFLENAKKNVIDAQAKYFELVEKYNMTVTSNLEE